MCHAWFIETDRSEKEIMLIVKSEHNHIDPQSKRSVIYNQASAR